MLIVEKKRLFINKLSRYYNQNKLRYIEYKVPNFG